MKRLLRLRLWFLGGINALILLHIVLYYVFDKRGVGCADFFGLATFLGKGQVTAGTVFLGGVILVTLLLGRVFCGWGCHFALFQDLLVRFLERIQFHVPFRRSRLELVIPPILFTVTLLYPIVAWWRHHGVPTSVTTDLAYPDVWHLLPNLKGVVLILLIDVVVLTLLFGSRAFCRYLCPYGLFLKFFHTLAPTRVVKVGNCSDCGACARACPTGVPIKFEIDNFAVIRDLNCMNCGDCVVACPDGALAIKPTRRAYGRATLKSLFVAGQPRWAEAVLLATAIAGLAIYRGREYGDFLAAGLGLTVGGTIIVAIKPTRLLRARWVARLTIRQVRLGAAALALYLALGMLGQALGVRTLSHAEEALQTTDYDAMLRTYARGAQVARTFRPFTFYLDDFHDRAASQVSALAATADRLMNAGSWRDAESIYRSILLVDPDEIGAHGNLGTTLMKQDRYWEAATCYMAVLNYDPNDLVVLYHLAITRIELGQMEEAVSIVRKMLSIDTVGNAYELILNNPLFRLLERDPTYRRAMAVYRTPSGTSPRHGEEN